jgi:hypothetical protein
LTERDAGFDPRWGRSECNEGFGVCEALHYLDVIGRNEAFYACRLSWTFVVPFSRTAVIQRIVQPGSVTSVPCPLSRRWRLAPGPERVERPACAHEQAAAAATARCTLGRRSVRSMGRSCGQPRRTPQSHQDLGRPASRTTIRRRISGLKTEFCGLVHACPGRGMLSHAKCATAGYRTGAFQAECRGSIPFTGSGDILRGVA